MHLIVAAWLSFAAFRWADWGNWKKFLPTMLYMPACNLLYFYLTTEYRLWHVIPDMVLSQTGVDLLYSFIVFPSTVLLFLSNYPLGPKRQLLHLLKWVLMYAAVEWIGLNFGKIAYFHGWSFGWSVFFLCTMFPMLYLHHIKPVAAYALSVFWVVFYLLVFQVPIR